MLTEIQYNNLVESQKKLNTIISTDWMEERIESDYDTAMIVELSECIEHLGYKWWKHQTVDLKQAQMEVVDVWFFFLCTVILTGKEEMVKRSFVTFSEYETQKFNKEETIESIKYLLHHITLDRQYGALFVDSLWDITRAIGLSSEALYLLYMGKLVLNIFRQEHGYNDGSYIKIWNGKEDNEVLMDCMMETLDPIKLEQLLSEKYKEISLQQPES